MNLIFSKPAPIIPLPLPSELCKKEIGGRHYIDMKVQPIDLILFFNADFLQGNIIKYVSRYKYKGGQVDLQKAKHCVEMYIMTGFSQRPARHLTPQEYKEINLYCKSNNLPIIVFSIIRCVVENRPFEAKHFIEKLIKRIY